MLEASRRELGKRGAVLRLEPPVAVVTGPHPRRTIGRLALHARGAVRADARRLAELVALALARVPVRPADNVDVTVAPQPGRTVEQLAGAVAHAIEDALRVEGR